MGELEVSTADFHVIARLTFAMDGAWQIEIVTCEGPRFWTRASSIDH